MSIIDKKLQKYEASISGMTCSNCSNYLESSLKKISFVKFANVNLVTEKALIIVDIDSLELAKLENLQIISSESEVNNDNLELVRSAILKLGFGVNNISKINESENKFNRFLNLIFKKENINEILRKFDDKKIHNLNQLEAIERGNIMYDTPRVELSESILKNQSDDQYSNQINNNFVQNGKLLPDRQDKENKKLSNKKKTETFFEEETDKLQNHELDFICCVPGVIGINLINNIYYRLEYDTTIIKGHELLSFLEDTFLKIITNEKNVKTEKLKIPYRITYINEFKKNTKEIYTFIPTTNFINLIIVIILLILIMSFSMIFKGFDFAIEMKNYFLFGNIDSYLFMGLIFSFALIFAYGLRIYKKAFMSLWNSRLVNMETLIALGSISAIILTIINLVKLIQEDKKIILENLNKYSKNNDSNMNSMSMNGNGISSNITNSNYHNDGMDLSEMTMHAAEAAAAVLAIFIIGKYVEEKAKNNIKKLTINMFSDERMLLKNKSRYVKPANKTFSNFLVYKKVDVGLLEKDDFCTVKTGDLLLFDCVIVKGSLEVNENSNYGYENIVKRGIGDKLKSGSQIIKILEENTIVIVNEVVENSILFKVIKEMSVCLNQKLKFQHFIDKIVKYFVPIIIIISIITFIIWFIIKIFLVDFKKDISEEELKKKSYLTVAFIFERAISILVVSCPCAFGLAIPTVTTISLNKALKSGILIKNLSILPEIRKANTFVFDKTGTMTIVRRDVKIEYLKYEGINVYENNRKFKTSYANVDQDFLYEKGNNINSNGDNEFDELPIDHEKNEACSENSFRSFPLYDAIAALEKSQKHPIAEIMYSFAVRQIQGTNSNEKNNDELLTEKLRLNSDNFVKEKSQEKYNNFELKIEYSNKSNKISNIYIVDETIENLSCGIKSKISWKSLDSNYIGKEHTFLIGNTKFIEEINSIDIPEKLKDLLYQISLSHFTIILVCIDKEILGIFSIDTSSIIRPELESVLETIKKNKMNDLYILSGDNINSVEEVGKKLNIEKEKCIGGVSDFEKKTFLANLKKEKKSVLMIGDGINDVLSISEADFGISFNANSQFNLVASDIIFMKEDLNLIMILMRISKLTYNFIWINIFWAFIYNIFMIPITAGIFYSFWDYLMSPTVSSLAMLCSSLLIILTSNLLRCFIK